MVVVSGTVLGAGLVNNEIELLQLPQVGGGSDDPPITGTYLLAGIGTDGKPAILELNSDGTIGSSAPDLTGYAKLDGSNQPFTGPLSIQMTPTTQMLLGKDGTGAELWRLGSDGLGDPTVGIPDVAVVGGNVFLGKDAGRVNAYDFGGYVGQSIVAVGWRAGYSHTTGYANTFVGAGAGYAVTTAGDLVAIGTAAMCGNIVGNNCVAVGNLALGVRPLGDDNIGIGRNAGTGIFISDPGGPGAGDGGYNNIAIGRDAIGGTEGPGDAVVVGNVAIGYQALRASGDFNGSYGVALGYQAGYYENGSHHLWIDNRSRSNLADGQVKALMYGTFADTKTDQRLRVNAVLELPEVTTPAVAATDYARIYADNGGVGGKTRLMAIFQTGAGVPVALEV